MDSWIEVGMLDGWKVLSNLQPSNLPTLQRCVAIELDAEPVRRAHGPREIDAHQSIQETRADTDRYERVRNRQMLARSRAADIAEQHEPRGRPLIPQLDAAAPERIAALRVAVVAAHRAGPAEVPVALHRDAPGRHPAAELERGGHAPQRRRHAQRRAHARELECPRPTVHGDVGIPAIALG